MALLRVGPQLPDCFTSRLCGHLGLKLVGQETASRVAGFFHLGVFAWALLSCGPLFFESLMQLRYWGLRLRAHVIRNSSHLGRKRCAFYLSFSAAFGAEVASWFQGRDVISHGTTCHGTEWRMTHARVAVLNEGPIISLSSPSC